MEPGGSIGVIGAYFRRAPAAKDDAAKLGRLGIDVGEAWDRALSINMGQTPVLRYLSMLYQLVLNGQYPIGEVVNAQAFPIDEANEAWKRLRGSEVIKPILSPNGLVETWGTVA